MILRLSIILSIILLFGGNIWAQIGEIPLNENKRLSHYRAAYPEYKWNTRALEKYGQDDTLELPFFEDFTSEDIYPDSSKWRDNDVYVNRHFPIKPPSYGVATFDFLNEFGSPYKTLQKDLTGGGDTLSSQAIDLTSKGGASIGPQDSVYLSFYYQPRGLGDFIKSTDSLLLEFLSDSGSWEKIWAVPGKGFSSFVQVMIPITENQFFHKAFQFRFVNWTHYWGNNNHWHLDFIYLNSGRSMNDIYSDDYSIQSSPTSLLKRYAAMPYEHFLEDVSGELEDSVYIGITNNNDQSITALVRYDHEFNGSNIGGTLFSENSATLVARSNSVRKLPIQDISGLSGFPVVVDRKFFIKENGATNPTPYQENDEFHSQQIFDRYFAYDDGSAETGFGFNDLNGKEGAVAVRFELNKPDTLRGIGMYFTHNINVLGDVRYNLDIWRSIARPGREDDLATSIPIKGVKYTTDINGYYYFLLSEPIALSAGDFYVGWTQGSDFNLGVGFDKNGGNLYQGVALNKDIFFNVGEGWQENTSSDLVGVPMIRPIVGKSNPFVSSTKSMKQSILTLYPNPAYDVLNIEGNTQRLTNAVIHGLDGREHLVNWINDKTIDVSALKSGIYLLKFIDSDGRIAAQKFVID